MQYYIFEPLQSENLLVKIVALTGFGIAGVLVGLILFHLLSIILQKSIGSSKGLIRYKLRPTFLIFTGVIFLNIFLPAIRLEGLAEFYTRKVLFILFVSSFAFLLVKITSYIKEYIYERQDISIQDNLQERKVRTQISFIEKVIDIVIMLISVSVILMSFDGVREIGTSILASAGIAGIIIGLAAQKSISNLLAGFQIAFTQPIRIDDVVIIEGEWGRIEEITLTYVVVKIWDQRRLVVPISYFIEKPFQNWTRMTAELLGTVYLYTDYRLPVEEIRKEQTRLLKENQLWDGKVNVVTVTNSTEKAMEIRLLVSARNSGDAWDLRCFLREKMITFIQKHYPECLPRTRVEGLKST